MSHKNPLRKGKVRRWLAEHSNDDWTFRHATGRASGETVIRLGKTPVGLVDTMQSVEDFDAALFVVYASPRAVLDLTKGERKWAALARKRDAQLKAMTELAYSLQPWAQHMQSLGYAQEAQRLLELIAVAEGWLAAEQVRVWDTDI